MAHITGGGPEPYISEQLKMLFLESAQRGGPAKSSCAWYPVKNFPTMFNPPSVPFDTFGPIDGSSDLRCNGFPASSTILCLCSLTKLYNDQLDTVKNLCCLRSTSQMRAMQQLSTQRLNRACAMWIVLCHVGSGLGVPHFVNS